jgi:hypothetical protein
MGHRYFIVKLASDLSLAIAEPPAKLAAIFITASSRAEGTVKDG